MQKQCDKMHNAANKERESSFHVGIAECNGFMF